MESPAPLTAEQIQAQMHGIRRDFRDNVKGIVANANQIFDWKSYVRSFPWVSVGVVAAVGYLLVPRRMKVIAYDKAAIEQYLKENQLVVAPPEVPPQRTSQVGGASHCAKCLRCTEVFEQTSRYSDAEIL